MLLKGKKVFPTAQSLNCGKTVLASRVSSCNPDSIVVDNCLDDVSVVIVKQFGIQGASGVLGDEAKAEIQKAQSTADKAQESADLAQSSADNAQATADNALSKVNSIGIATLEKVGLTKPDGTTIVIAEDGTLSSTALQDEPIGKQALEKATNAQNTADQAISDAKVADAKAVKAQGRADDAYTLADQAKTLATEAKTEATTAKDSATAKAKEANQSAINASASEGNASQSALNASQSATASQESAQSSKDEADRAKTEADRAKEQADLANGSATSAQNSANEAKEIIKGAVRYDRVQNLTEAEAKQGRDNLRITESKVEIATIEKVGVVKPDGTTITITPDGTITSVGGGGSADAVLYTPQSLDVPQQTQARTNIDALGKSEKATSAVTADKAVADGGGLNIAKTYATKTALSGVESLANSASSTAGTALSSANEAKTLATTADANATEAKEASITAKDSATAKAKEAAKSASDALAYKGQAETASADASNAMSASETFSQASEQSALDAKKYAESIQKIGIATTATTGVVKPDGTSIKVTTDGTISADIPDVPVKSVNGQTGEVVLDLTGAVKSVNGKTGVISGLATTESLNGKFDKTGGVLSGSVAFSTQGDVIKTENASSEIRVCSGTSEADGASLTLRGKDFAYNGGSFILTAKGTDGTSKILYGMPNGSLTWNGQNVILANKLTTELSKKADSDKVVSSFNGSTGAVTYTAPVESVNGKTGAVVIDIPDAPVKSVNGQTGAVQIDAVLYSPQKLSDSQKLQARANISAADASSVTGVLKYTSQTLQEPQKAQARTNIGAVSSVDLNSKINIVGARGSLAGKETASVLSGSQTITADSADTIVLKTTGATTLTFTHAPENVCAVKVLALKAKNSTTLSVRGAVWANSGDVPAWGTKGKSLVLVASFIGGRVVLSVSDNEEA